MVLLYLITLILNNVNVRGYDKEIKEQQRKIDSLQHESEMTVDSLSYILVTLRKTNDNDKQRINELDKNIKQLRSNYKKLENEYAKKEIEILNASDTADYNWFNSRFPKDYNPGISGDWEPVETGQDIR